MCALAIILKMIVDPLDVFVTLGSTVTLRLVPQPLRESDLSACSMPMHDPTCLHSHKGKRSECQLTSMTRNVVILV
jgi:hypothetical protein